MRNEAVRKLEHVKAKIHYVKEMVIWIVLQKAY
jgi:hypothetical protein